MDRSDNRHAGRYPRRRFGSPHPGYTNGMADLDDIDPDDIPVAHDDGENVPDPDPDAVAQEDEDDAPPVTGGDDDLSVHPLNPRPTGS